MAITDTGDGAGGEATARLVIWPSRSLGRRGSWLLPGVVGAVFGLVAALAAAIGAWPVALYAIIAAAAFACAICCNNRSGRLVQELAQAGVELKIKTQTVHWKSPHSVEFNIHWVRVIERLDRHGESRVALEQSGRRAFIGDFLGPAERHELAEAIRRWIADCRAEALRRP